MLTSIGRAATRRLVSIAATSSRSIVFSKATTLHPLQQLTTAGTRFTAVRGFAAAKTTAATTKKTTTAKKAAAPKKTAAKPKATAKAKTKATAKPKAKKTGGTKTRRKKPLSDEAKAKLEKRTLKKTALYNEPKSLPETAWVVYLTENVRGVSTTPETARDRFGALASQYRALPATEMRRLEETAQKNKLASAANYKSWVKSLSPVQVADANRARHQLKLKYDFPKGQLKTIHDDRQPKRPRTAYALFTKARWASGDITAKVTDAAASIGSEWKSLPEDEKQPYYDQAKTDLARYEKDLFAILGRKPSPRKASA